jgi:amidase
VAPGPDRFTQDRAGPIARTADDAARLLAAIAGYDPRDPQSALSFRRVPDDTGVDVGVRSARPARRVHSAVLNTMAQLELDAIVYPMKTQPAWLIDGEADPDATISGGGNVLSSIPGLPTVVVPAGLPVTIEFLGSPFSEPELLGLAHHYQAATNRRRPPASTPSLQLART